MGTLGRVSCWLIVGLSAVSFAGCMTVSQPPVDSGLLSQQNVDKALELRTQAEIEQLLGLPNSTPNFNVGFFCPYPPVGQAVAWEQTVSCDGEIRTRKLSVAFDPTTGEKRGQCYVGAPMRPVQPSLWSRLSDWVTDGLAVKKGDVSV